MKTSLSVVGVLRHRVVALLLVGLSAVAVAHEFKSKDLVIEHP